MGKIKVFDVVYSNDHGIFHAGQEVVGYVLLVLTDAKRFEELTIEFKGKAKTHWTRHHGKSSAHYSAEENYFQHVVNTTYPQKFENQRLTPGRHQIAFSFRIPQHLPSSFEGPHGHIRYLCSITLQRAWKWNVSSKRPFTIIACEDLNSLPSAHEPLRISDSTDLTCCCCSRGAISIEIQVPKRGFVPGESIPLSCEIINNSDRIVPVVCLRVKQYVIYKGNSFWGFGDSKHTSTEVVKLEKEINLKPGHDVTWENEPVSIPPLPPRLIGCGIINVSYVLKVDVGPSYINCSLPIILGTVPIRESRGGARWNARRYRGIEPPPSYEDVTPPPTYRECVLGGNTIVSDDDDVVDEDNSTSANSTITFAPFYVYYNSLR